MTGFEKFLKVIARIHGSSIGVSDGTPEINLYEKAYESENERYGVLWDKKIPDEKINKFNINALLVFFWIFSQEGLHTAVGKDNLEKLVTYTTEHTVYGRKETFKFNSFSEAGWTETIHTNYNNYLETIKGKQILLDIWNKLFDNVKVNEIETNKKRYEARTAAADKSTEEIKAAVDAVPNVLHDNKFEGEIKLKFEDYMDNMFGEDEAKRNKLNEYLNHKVNEPLRTELSKILNLGSKPTKDKKNNSVFEKLPVMILSGGSNGDIRGEFAAYKNTISSEKNNVNMIGGKVANIWAPGLEKDATRKSELFLEAYNTIVERLKSNEKSLSTQDDNSIRKAIDNLAKRESSLYGLLKTLMKYNQLLEKHDEDTDIGDKIRKDSSMIKAVSTYFNKVGKIHKSQSKLLTVFGEIVSMHHLFI